MNKLPVILVSFAYLAMLFIIAYWVERRRKKGLSVVTNAWIYSLSLAVYCTGWTFYGSVGRAATNGMEFITIYLGPCIMAALFIPVLQKILRISKSQRINSIADFISARYGNNFTLGVVVTICCIIGVIPYIALQIKAVSASFHVITNSTDNGMPLIGDDTFYITAILSVFIILFGTRTVDPSERHEGLVAAIAFESIIKLVAFIVAGIFITYGIFNGFGDLFRQAESRKLEQFVTMQGDHAYSNWIGMTFVSMLSIILLPRQFQVSVVENTSEKHLQKAIWLFPLYLFVINIFVLPIAIAGVLSFGSAQNADMFVLSLPLSKGENVLSMLVYLGGFSAASSMVIVETIAMATMMSNHLVIPFMLPDDAGISERTSFSRRILNVRRVCILIILLAAYAYNAYIARYFSLVSIGLVSMAAVAQFAPAFLGGIYWKRGSRSGALSGIIAGFIVWGYTLIIPFAANAGVLSKHIVELGPWGQTWLRPTALFGLEEFDLITHSIFWSMLINLGMYVVISSYSRLSARELYQARIFTEALHQDTASDSVWKGHALMPDIETLLQNFIGAARSQKLLESYAARHRISLTDKEADPRIVAFAERILSGVIGSASARFMISNITQEDPISMEKVLGIVKESQQVLELNKELKKKSFELTKATEMLQFANDQLTRIDVLKDEFLYTVTHELRTPLTSVRALAEIIHDNPELPDDQRQFYISGIIKETERLTYMITQVLTLERYESGREKLHLSAIDMRMLITEVCASLQPLADEKDARIITSLSDSVILIPCDKDMIKQVLYNLVSNAIKFVPESHGEIHILAGTDYDELQISVRDNGKGIPAESRELIFDKFFQARNQTLKKPTGSGLGLAICKRIIEMHNGRIWVDPTTANGAVFTFTLPFNR